MTPKKQRWSFSEVSRNVHRFRVDLPRVGDEQYFLLHSDVHWDNPNCDRTMLKRHLDLALKRNAPVIDIGDFFCAMQGKYDKRSNKADIRAEHQKGDYLDALVRTAANWLEPYAPILTLRGWGNHETAMLKSHETDLTERLVERLRSCGASNVRHGGFSGFIRFSVMLCQTRNNMLTYHYHHGYGGGGPVTRGVIQTNRMAVYLADADIVHTGHTHDAWQVSIQRLRLNFSNIVEQARQLHVRTAGYKEEHGDGYGGWHIERGGPPKPIGAAWLRLYHASGGKVDFEVTEAR